MNPLRNKYVVIGLAVAALWFLYNSLKPIWQHGRPTAQTKSVPLPVAAPTPTLAASHAPATPASRPQAEATEPGPGVDLNKVGWSFDGAPRRDPFQVIGPGSTNLARLYPPVSEVLALTAIL